MNQKQGKMRTFQKPKDVKYVLRRLWQYLYRFKWSLLLAFFLTVASNLFSLVGPLLSGWAIDAIGNEAGQADFQKIYFYAI